MKKFNYVYLTTNLLNSKQYIGSHCTDNIDDNYLGSGLYFIQAVKKYGKENFRREILEECKNLEDARRKEELYIKKFDSLKPNGYNLSPTGGIGTSYTYHSDETKQKMSEAAKNKKPERCSMFGKKHSIETKLKMSETAKKRKTEECSMYGKNHSKGTKQKMRKKALGRKLSEETKKKISETLKKKKISPPNRGKTLEEIHGKEKALKIKEKMSISRENNFINHMEQNGKYF